MGSSFPIIHHGYPDYQRYTALQQHHAGSHPPPAAAKATHSALRGRCAILHNTDSLPVERIHQASTTPIGRWSLTPP